MVDEDQAFEYDVQLTRLPSDTLRQRYPHMTVRSTAAQTALRRRVDGPAELSALLVEIGTLGLTLTDVHRVASVEDGPAGAGLYELRVLGELGEPSLRYLKCTHYHVEKQALVRLTLVAGELHSFLQACTDCGAGLARVHRVGPPSVERPRPLVGSV
ncbi:hypothetical protein NYO98_14185 [Nocardioides sp. STR2]|uniref:Uncharacterized protein n=1 Tax=Nocardioides pini TaxID=2975053 RepID=A0ABT4CEM3_9ACTN|nr:hypothetical protein [Nocardioides pini]MCY4727433.1 hypothetical protein [Nocardioides pini]